MRFANWTAVFLLWGCASEGSGEKPKLDAGSTGGTAADAATTGGTSSAASGGTGGSSSCTAGAANCAGAAGEGVGGTTGLAGNGGEGGEGPSILAGTPPMGWNSWNKFGCNVSEVLIKEIADAMVSSGMRDAGYEYVNIDDCWQVERDTDGVIVADDTNFPSGIAGLADYVHGQGLKLGVYSDRGTMTCAGRPGSEAHEEQDAETYASWGVDYLKYDNCNASLDMQTQYEAMQAALLGASRPIVFSICAWTFYDWMPETGQLWRTTGDISDSWGSAMGILDINQGLAANAGPGHWNDPDMLEVGNGGMTEVEYRSHFSLWAMMAAPLIAGNDLRDMTETTQSILTAPEIIAVDQDSAGIQGERVSQDGSLEVWSKALASGAHAVALFNRGDTASDITAQWSDIGVSGSAQVRDLWAASDLGASTDSYTANVAPHATVMLKITEE